MLRDWFLRVALNGKCGWFMLRIEVEKVRICKLYDATGNLWALGVHVIMLTDNRQLVYQAVEDGA